MLWNKEADFVGQWSSLEPRQDCMLKHISDRDRSVLDLGAGMMYIKDKLPPQMDYYPVDYFERFPETIVCNLQDDFPAVCADVAFCSGVFEYINNYDLFISNLSEHVDKVIISYAALECCNHMGQRKYNGWVNHLSKRDFIKCFSQYFNLTETDYDRSTGQYIFVFKLEREV